MRLVSLTLENIKSYVQETVNFYEGVNFISGINGAGKSTLIEAIGFVLFDTQPFSNMRQLVREGEKSGTITLIFEAQDERIYRVVRRLRLPSASTWSVYDVENGCELSELHGNQDVKAWLAESLGLPPALDPALLFEDVIGVSQGKFTAPFLEKAARRKELFNTILQLESYRQAYDKTAGLVRSFEEGLKDKDHEILRLSDRVGDYEASQRELEAQQDLKKRLGQELELLGHKLKTLENEILGLEDTRSRLEKVEAEITGLNIKAVAIQEREARLENDVHVAQQAEEHIKRATDGYRKHLELQARQKEYELKRREKEALERKIQELNTGLAALNSEIKAGIENRALQLQQAEAEQITLRTEGEACSKILDKAAEAKELGEAWHQRLQQAKAQWRMWEDDLALYQQEKIMLVAEQSNAQQLKRELDRLQQGLAAWGHVEQAVSLLPDCERQSREVQERLAQVSAKMATLIENQLATKDGNCPFLQVPCQNVEGDLEGYFRKAQKLLEPEVRRLEEEKEKLEAAVSKGREAQETMILLLHQKEQFEATQKRAEALRVKLEALESDLQARVAPEMIDQRLEVAREVYRIRHSAGGVLLGDSEAECDALQQLFERYRQAYLQADWELAAGLLQEVKVLGGSAVSRLEQDIKPLLDKQAAEFSTLQERLNFLRARFKTVSTQMASLQQDTSLSSKEKEKAEQEEQLAALSEQRAAYLNLDRDTDHNQELLEHTQADYVTYMQNMEGAGKLQALQLEKQRLIEQKLELQAQLEKEIKIKEALVVDYQPQHLEDLRLQREGAKEEANKKEVAYEFAQREAQNLAALIEEKQKARGAIAALQKQQAQEQKGLELLRLVRKTLNGSGEKMAHLYRQYLGQEANSLYQRISRENVALVWGEDYDIKMIDTLEGKERERVFLQLSGGEKMSSALAVRLALLKELSGLGIGFFDEPTANLDEKRRANLAHIIPTITQSFRQLFVISHDDSFDAITENVIVLKKDPCQGTRVVAQ